MTIDSGDTAWLLASSALVLLMAPGVAFFYGGMVRVKSVLNMLMMSFGAIGVVSVLWVLYGYSLAFGADSTSVGLLGNLDHLGMAGTLTAGSGTLPTTVFAAFQLMFAVITVALISGAIADRARFGAWMLFAAVWVTVVYVPVAHWVFFFDEGNGGWIADRLGALDFAGGTAVHVNAGAAALALALVLGRRTGWPKERFTPHNLPLVLVGAGMLWFGWFGFNAGSAVAANGQAGIAFLNTQVAAGAAMLSWLLVEKIRDRHATTLGGASGAIAGLVAITPACAAVDPVGAVAIGLVAGALCALAVGLKYRLRFDDSLDVVGVHLVGGTVGALLIGVLAAPAVTGILGAAEPPAGLAYGGGLGLLGRQAVAVVAVAVFSFVVTWLLATVIDKTVGFRISVEDEVTGVDTTTHAESGYDLVGMSAVGSTDARLIAAGAAAGASAGRLGASGESAVGGATQTGGPVMSGKERS